MTANIEQVKDRIRKLLRTSQDDAATENEIEISLRLAKSMMDRHHLDDDDLVEEPADQWRDIEFAKKGDARSTCGTKLYAWEKHLASFVAKFVGGVGCYLDNSTQLERNGRVLVFNGNGKPKEGKGVVFYGIAEDALLAKDLYDELRMTIIAMGRLSWGSCYQGDGGAYCQGFVAGLFTKLTKVDEQNRIAAQGNSTALILVARRQDLIERKTQAATKWLRDKGLKLRKGGRSQGARGSREAYSEGVQDGKLSKVGVNRTKKIC